MLADAATGCSTTFGGCGSSCPRVEAGADGATEAGVCSIAGKEDGFADCCAFALNVSSKKAVITQCQIRITQPRFRLSLSRTSKSSGSVASCSLSPAGCLSGARAGQQPVGVYTRYVESCRPSANVDGRVKISLIALFLSGLRQTSQLGQVAIRKSPVAAFHQGGAFQPRGWRTAQDRHDSVGEIDSMTNVGFCTDRVSVQPDSSPTRMRSCPSPHPLAGPL